MQPRDLQHEAMRIYQTLVNLHDDWGGKLVLYRGSGCAHSGSPAAVSIAGGALLAIHSDAAAMKSALRAGYLDFVVNTLDEALRTLKNEVRQKRPLTVGLIADVEATLTEMVERGVQPDLQLVSSDAQREDSSQIQTLCSRGMSSSRIRLHGDDTAAHSVLIHRGERHSEYYFPAPDAAAFREIDIALLAALPADDLVRRRWLERVPKYLREARTGGRWVWLSDDEIALLVTQGLTPAPRP